VAAALPPIIVGYDGELQPAASNRAATAAGTTTQRRHAPGPTMDPVHQRGPRTHQGRRSLAAVIASSTRTQDISKALIGP